MSVDKTQFPVVSFFCYAFVDILLAVDGDLPYVESSELCDERATGTSGWSPGQLDISRGQLALRVRTRHRAVLSDPVFVVNLADYSLADSRLVTMPLSGFAMNRERTATFKWAILGFAIGTVLAGLIWLATQHMGADGRWFAAFTASLGLAGALLLPVSMRAAAKPVYRECWQCKLIRRSEAAQPPQGASTAERMTLFSLGKAMQKNPWPEVRLLLRMDDVEKFQKAFQSRG